MTTHVYKDEEWLRRLADWGQSHLIPPNSHPQDVQKLCREIAMADSSYPGGLETYLKRARQLLEASQAGENPFKGCTAYKPLGERVPIPSSIFDHFESLGSGGVSQKASPGDPAQREGSEGQAREGEVASERKNEESSLRDHNHVKHRWTRCAFVLVAGGLGERLGYQDIKIGLPCETTTGKTFAQLYCEYIRAIQDRYHQQNSPSSCSSSSSISNHSSSCPSDQTSHSQKCSMSEHPAEEGDNDKEAGNHVGGTGRSGSGEMFLFPLAIMTSDDTHQKTVKLFEENHYFGLQRSQVAFMKQGKVPALLDNEAHIAVSPDDPYSILTKPHGHGDVHTLLYQHGLVKKWKYEGVQWLLFFQDTNPLIFRAMAVALGVSMHHNLAMNTITVPRKPAEAMGAICKLMKEDGTSSTINVEYNVLGPLLQAQGSGDVADAVDGYSHFPGNTNVLLFKIEPYCSVLQRTAGTVPEFVNPKYKDKSRTSFKSPTRLECMMQDFPRLFSPEDPVGFTELDRWFCYSSVKNNIQDARAKAASGLSPECALSGECDVYRNNTRLLSIAVESLGGQINIGKEETIVANDISYGIGPRMVLSPSWAVTLQDMKERMKGIETFSISTTSTLLIEGDVFIKHLELDGAAILRAKPGCRLVIERLVVKNEGWPLVILKGGELAKASPEIAMRGFVFEKRQTYVAENSEEGTTKTIHEPV